MSKLQLVLHELEKQTSQLSVDQLLAELQIAVERVSFSNASGKPLVYNSASIAQLDMLFEDEISEAMRGYVQWLFQNNLLAVLTGNTGIMFLNECIKRYRRLTQVRVLTAIPLQESLKNHLQSELSGRYPQGTRFIFEVSPSVIAGFIIDDGTHRIDKSLQSYQTFKVKEAIKNNLKRPIHG